MADSRCIMLDIVHSLRYVYMYFGGWLYSSIQAISFYHVIARSDNTVEDPLPGMSEIWPG
jgi:hypothetical protein